MTDAGSRRFYKWRQLTFLTSNSRYNFDALDGAEALALLKKLRELSGVSWNRLHLIGKESSGLEYITRDCVSLTLPSGKIKCVDADGCTREQEINKVVIFRFLKQKGRIIGVKQKRSPVFCILGWELDFSAYDHGS